MNEKNWLIVLARLRINRAVTPPSPHKPLFLLCMLDVYEQGQFRDGRLRMTPELYLRFQACWKAVAHRTKQPPTPQFPFHYLSGDGLWEPLTTSGQKSDDYRTTRLCIFDEGWQAFLNDAAHREAARQVLLERYFSPEERIALCETLQISLPKDFKTSETLTQQMVKEAREEGRDARFRIDVVQGYQFTCAMTGHRLVLLDSGASLVDAAHIHKFASSKNNNPDNGLALSKNAHWLFDKGLWTVDTPRAAEYRIRVAPDGFMESSPFGHSLKLFDNRELFFPAGTSLRPNPVHLAWHQENVFAKHQS